MLNMSSNSQYCYLAIREAVYNCIILEQIKYTLTRQLMYELSGQGILYSQTKTLSSNIKPFGPGDDALSRRFQNSIIRWPMCDPRLNILLCARTNLKQIEC